MRFLCFCILTAHKSIRNKLHVQAKAKKKPSQMLLWQQNLQFYNLIFFCFSCDGEQNYRGILNAGDENLKDSYVMKIRKNEAE